MAQRGKLYKASDHDREFVHRAIQAGSTIAAIAKCLNLHKDTLRKHYLYEISVARQVLVNKAMGVVDDCLTDGSLDAAKYVLSRAAGWTERTDLTSSDGTMSTPPTRIVIRGIKADSE